MQIFYFHVPAEMPKDLRPDAAVVIDVLRATTTIAWALHNGAEAVQAFASLDDLRAAAAAWHWVAGCLEPMETMCLDMI